MLTSCSRSAMTSGNELHQRWVSDLAGRVLGYVVSMPKLAAEKKAELKA